MKLTVANIHVYFPYVFRSYREPVNTSDTTDGGNHIYTTYTAWRATLTLTNNPLLFASEFYKPHRFAKKTAIYRAMLLLMFDN